MLFFCMTLMGKLYLFSILFIMNKNEMTREQMSHTQQSTRPSFPSYGLLRQQVWSRLPPCENFAS